MEKHSEKRQVILKAAGPVFMRHGYARTTMGLLAEAANISRPALYLVFPNKDELFSAVVLWLTDNLIRDIGKQIAPIPDVREKLLAACQAWSASVYDVHAANPLARDMDNLEFAAVRELYRRFEDFLSGVLAAATPNSPGAAKACRSAAHMLVFALRGCRLGARDRAEMHEMNRLLVLSVCDAMESENMRPQRRRKS